MENIIKKIKEEVLKIYPSFNKLILNILFSKGHIESVIYVDNEICNLEIGVENLIAISNYLNKYEGKENKLIVSISDKGIIEKFEFDEDYYISSNQELLFEIIEKNRKNKKIEKQKLKDLLSIAKYAIQKSDIKKLLSKECNLYLVIESCQLVSDILPNLITDSDKYLLLCNITKNDLQQPNIESIILGKIDETYK